MNIRRFMQAVARSIYHRGEEVASAPLVFLSVPIVTAFQLPAYFIGKAGYLNLSIFTNEVFAVLAVPLILIGALKLNVRRLVPLTRVSFGTVLLLAVFMLGADVLIEYLTFASEQLFPLPEEVRQQLDRIMSAPNAQTFVIKLFVLCIIPAICEEVYFRGFFQTSIEASWGRGWALAVTAVVFAGLHGNIHYFHLYLLLGLIFGWVYAVTGTLWAPIICHVVNNCWTFIIHVIGFDIPIEGVSIYLNSLIVIGGAVLFIVGAHLLKRRGTRD